jgi:hypothetical protein
LFCLLALKLEENLSIKLYFDASLETSGVMLGRMRELPQKRTA